MSRPGKIIRSAGPYRIEEELVDYDDGTTMVIGYHVVGPEGRLSALLPEPQARAALDELLRRDGANGGIDGVLGSHDPLRPESDSTDVSDDAIRALVRIRR